MPIDNLRLDDPLPWDAHPPDVISNVAQRSENCAASRLDGEAHHAVPGSSGTAAEADNGE